MKVKFLVTHLQTKESPEGKISWAKAADAYSTLLKFVKSWSCYSAQEVMQLHILHSTFLQKRKECTKQAGIRQMFQQACNSHTDLHYYPEQGSDEGGWTVSVRGESSGIGWWYVKCRRHKELQLTVPDKK